KADASLLCKPLVLAGRAGGGGAALATLAAQEANRHRLFFSSPLFGRSTGTPTKPFTLAQPRFVRPPGFGVATGCWRARLAVPSPPRHGPDQGKQGLHPRQHDESSSGGRV